MAPPRRVRPLGRRSTVRCCPACDGRTGSCGGRARRRRSAKARRRRRTGGSGSATGHAPISGDGNGFGVSLRRGLRAASPSLGLTHHRLSIEWARIEPEPGVHDDAAVAHYRDMLARARATPASCPWVCLHHFTLPRWFADDGGFLVEAQSHRRLGAPRRVRGRDVRRSRRRLAAGERDELLRPRRVPRRRMAARPRRLGRDGDRRRGDPPRDRRGGACACGRPARRSRRSSASRPSSRRTTTAATARTARDVVRHVLGARARPLPRRRAARARTASRSSVPTCAGAFDLIGFSYYAAMGVAAGRAGDPSARRAGVAARLRHLGRRRRAGARPPARRAAGHAAARCRVRHRHRRRRACAPRTSRAGSRSSTTRSSAASTCAASSTGPASTTTSGSTATTSRSASSTATATCGRAPRCCRRKPTLKERAGI